MKDLGYICILLKTNNLCENKDMNTIIFIKFKDTEEYKIYEIKVNNQVNVSYYNRLFVNNAFGERNFVTIPIEDLKKKLKNEKDNLLKIICSGKIGVISIFLKELAE